MILSKCIPRYQCLKLPVKDQFFGALLSTSFTIKISSQLSSAFGAMPFVHCPLCAKRYPKSFISQHASFCKGTSKPLIVKATHRQLTRNTRQVPLKQYRDVFDTGNNDDALSLISETIARRSLTKVSSPDTASGFLSSQTDVPGFYIFHHAFKDIHDILLSTARDSPPQWNDYKYRQTKNYGPAYDLHRRTFLFGAEATRKTYPLPSYVHHTVLPRLRSLLPLLSDFHPNQLTVSLYNPIAGKTHIMPHNDCENAHIHTAVVGVSLDSSCTFTLILRRSISGLPNDIKRDFYLPPGSVYVMSHDSLRSWMHAIFPGSVKHPRISLTLRDISPRTAESRVRPARTPS